MTGRQHHSSGKVKSSTNKPGRKRPDHTRKKSPPQNDARSRAERAYRLLYELYQEIVTPKSGRAAPSNRGFTQTADPGRIEGPGLLSLPFRTDGDASGFAQELLDLYKANRNPASPCASFRAGRVYCYHCDSTGCDHASPPNHLSVFLGYTPTGFPMWDEFFSVLLEKGDPRIDELIQESPGIVSLCQEKKTLIAEQLNIFGERLRSLRHPRSNRGRIPPPAAIGSTGSNRHHLAGGQVYRSSTAPDGSQPYRTNP
ncbi:MAG: hypothetical protein KJ645_02780 [Planctomycetes bacterium]|nr:hypothetical protein [Planctomycetota bacterium]